MDNCLSAKSPCHFTNHVFCFPLSNNYSFLNENLLFIQKVEKEPGEVQDTTKEEVAEAKGEVVVAKEEPREDILPVDIPLAAMVDIHPVVGLVITKQGTKQPTTSSH